MLPSFEVRSASALVCPLVKAAIVCTIVSLCCPEKKSRKHIFEISRAEYPEACSKFLFHRSNLPCCGNAEPKLTYRFGKERIQQCEECGNFVITKSGLLKLFHFFGALFRGFPNEYYWAPFITGQKYTTLYEGNFLSEEKGIACFNLHTLSNAIEKMKSETIAKMDRRWWFPTWAANRADGSNV